MTILKNYGLDSSVKVTNTHVNVLFVKRRLHICIYIGIRNLKALLGCGAVNAGVVHMGL